MVSYRLGIKLEKKNALFRFIFFNKKNPSDCNCLNVYSDTEMIDVAEAIVGRENHCHDPNMLWLLAILSSRSVCVKNILTIIPELVEYLHAARESELSDVVHVGIVIAS